MGHIQHLSFESLIKMDHFQKEPPLNLKGNYWGTRGVERGQYLKEQIGNPSQIECPLWVKSGHPSQMVQQCEQSVAVCRLGHMMFAEEAQR
jgi:hypothetical protein